MLTDDLIIDHNFKYKKVRKYWDEFISLAHNINGGGSFYNIKQ